ncbi:hypothetical protein CONCODRAFT_84125 [Conidiobolus coronatus NRRL 28638]|uniref:RNI-like protein n=1 Tax=Conidiobolus coronatus (strain ATCC 28846 / CBS 209.66 / NRRL 28638) TaxID=796925 RepID=A0A137PBE8_CONC2|nr:hypothetical protein CONCODRAFT_84125 [Conidiobolus coronatus NRRL 28638]|eukprot:KXN72338.1 hypothetical protein CONCODRAFT_84125 [Conidiobolus coronatus NRRL 28638]
MQESKKLNNNNWQFILKLIRVYKHLNKSDLIELSCSSKCMYTQLSPVLFGTFKLNDKSKRILANLNQTIKNNCQSTQNKLKLINSISITCKLEKSDYFNLLTYFPNITSLKLTIIKVDLDQLNLIFNNFKLLIYLELKKVKISVPISLATSNDNVNLHIPLTLNQLKVYSCTFCPIMDREIPDSDEIMQTNNYCPYNSISNLKFNNLTQLTFINANKYGINFINNFLLNNPGLKRLSVELFEFNGNTFNLLENLKYLNNLNLMGCDKRLKFQKNQILPISSVTAMSLDQSFYRRNFQVSFSLIQKFPNLQHLKLIHINRNIHELEVLIKRLTNLKSLVLISKTTERRFTMKLESGSLIKLNFVNFNLNCIQLSNLKGLRKLRFLKVTNYCVGEGVDEGKLREECDEFGWDARFINNSVIYSKV